MKNVLNALLFLTLTLGVVGIACRDTSQRQSDTIMQATDTKKIRYYTCPMHPQIHADHPGACPICHMTLVPVYEEQGGEATSGGVMISPERQQLIGVTTSPVIKMSLETTITTYGTAAFDPDLAVAQREFLSIAGSSPDLKAAAKSRLRLLGMSNSEITALEQRGKSSGNLILPKSQDTVWVYAVLYESDMESVRPGLEATVTVRNQPEVIYKGTVRSLDPVIDPMTRSVRARIEVTQAGTKLRPNTYVNVVIKVPVEATLTIPKSAVIDTGTRRLAYVVHDGRHFEPREVTTGIESADNVEVLSGLKEGEQVVTSANFLIDSESQLKANLTGGGHNH